MSGPSEGRGGLEVVSAAGGRGPLQRGQVHQEVDGGGSNLEMVPAGQPQVYGPTTSTVEEVNPFCPVEGGDGFGGGRSGAGSDGRGSPESSCRKMLQMMILENLRLRQEDERC